MGPGVSSYPSFFGLSADYRSDRGEDETTQGHQLCLSWIQFLYKITNTNESLSNYYIYTRTPLWQWMNHKIFNVPMDIVCDTQINEIMHDMVLCSQLIFIIQRIPWNSTDQW